MAGLKVEGQDWDENGYSAVVKHPYHSWVPLGKNLDLACRIGQRRRYRCHVLPRGVALEALPKLDVFVGVAQAGSKDLVMVLQFVGACLE